MRQVWTGAVVAAAVLSLTACGGQGDAPASETQETAASVRPGTDVNGARISAARSTPED